MQKARKKNTRVTSKSSKNQTKSKKRGSVLQLQQNTVNFVHKIRHSVNFLTKKENQNFSPLVPLTPSAMSRNPVMGMVSNSDILQALENVSKAQTPSNSFIRKLRLNKNLQCKHLAVGESTKDSDEFEKKLKRKSGEAGSLILSKVR